MAFTCIFLRRIILPLVVCATYLPIISCAEIIKECGRSEIIVRCAKPKWCNTCGIRGNCKLASCSEGCDCRPEFYRNGKGICIPQSHCSDIQLSKWDLWWKRLKPTPLEELTPSIDVRDLYTPSKTDDGDYDYWRRKFLTITEEPDFWRFTPTPLDERYIYTPSSPVDEDYDWWKKYFSTTEDFRWKRLTSEPFIDRDIYPQSSFFSGSIFAIVTVLICMFIVFGACAVYLIKRVNQDIDSTTAAYANSRMSVPNRPTRRNSNIAPRIRNSTGAASNLNDATDKPPGYDVVVLSDLSVQCTKYPEVNPEYPPPRYEEDIVQKY